MLHPSTTSLMTHFIWITAESHGKKASDLTEADFEEVTCRTDKLSMYCESGKVREIMVGRILSQIYKYLRDPKTPQKSKPTLQLLKTKFKKYIPVYNYPRLNITSPLSRYKPRFAGGGEGTGCVDEY